MFRTSSATKPVRAIGGFFAMSLDTAIAPEVVLRGNAFLLQQALANLLDNAIEFSPAGSAIELALARADGRVRLSVADRGPGIPLDEQASIFETCSFSAGDQYRSTSSIGAGS